MLVEFRKGKGQIRAERGQRSAYNDNQNKWTKLELFGYVSLETEIVED